MKKLILLAALLSAPLAAQNAGSGSPRVQGVPDGFGDPVQVTVTGPTGIDVSITNGLNTAGSGYLGTGQLGQLDDTAPSAVTENQFAVARLGAQRQQLNQSPSVYPYSAILGTPATPIRGASGNVANASAAATLTGTATTTVYITGFTCTAGGATAAAEVDLTVTGTLGGTMTYTQGAPAGAGVPPNTLSVNFNPAYPASAVNTPIVVTMPALGAGNAHAACVATGFYM